MKSKVSQEQPQLLYRIIKSSYNIGVPITPNLYNKLFVYTIFICHKFFTQQPLVPAGILFFTQSVRMSTWGGRQE